MKTAIIIAAGGTGTRLWPLSTKKNPKQFVKLLGENSLLRQTYNRFIGEYALDDIFISTSLKFKDLLKKEIPEIPEKNIILEPISMDTGPAICLASAYIKAAGYDNTVYISCDHEVQNVNEFIRLIKIAEETVVKYPDQITLIGLNPTTPSTALGYIEMAEPMDRINGEMIFKVGSFREKPDYETAKKFVDDWRYLWNASYFIYNNDFLLNQFQIYAPETYESVQNSLKFDFADKNFEENYSKTFKQAFDYMILEKLENKLVIPANIGWSDVGTFKTVHELVNKDDLNNYVEGNVIFNDIENNLIINKSNKLIAVHGIKNLVIVDTENSILITSIDKAEDLKKLVEKLPDESK